MDLLFDPLFRVPLLTGLLVAATLPVAGCLLRLRGEWLAALGLAHLTGGAALAGMALGAPLAATAVLGAGVAAACKTAADSRGNTAYGVMILAGWSATLLIAANRALGETQAQALMDGQLYFAGPAQLAGVALTALLAAAALPWLNRRLIRAHCLPEDDRANHRPAWRWQWGFDGLVALLLIFAATSVGLMAAFALAFIPPWLAFVIARSWRQALLLSAVLGMTAYLVSFVAALAWDQPFGPLLVAVLLGLGTLGVALHGLRRGLESWLVRSRSHR